MSNLQRGLFAGDCIYKKSDRTIDDLKNAGFDFLALQSLYISDQGDLSLNEEISLAENGGSNALKDEPEFIATMKALKEPGSSIRRIELSIGGADSWSFTHIRNLTGYDFIRPNHILYRNFKALKNSIPQIDAINIKDENLYDADSSIKFAIMLGELGYKVSLCPYTLAGYSTALA